MKCPRCQRENPFGADFCGECGARLATVCAACGTPNPPGNKFCHNCGGPLTPGPSPAPSVSPETYTPRHLAEKILTSREALAGERKQITVLFADIKSSMELLADRDPEDARKVLDPVLERMMEAVHRYEGTVNQVMGDGIMALFGAPLAHDDHAVRACYAALRMQDAVRQYADGLRRLEGLPIYIRVGLNSGEVVVRSIGNDLRMDYTAVGQTTHLAARMEQLATPGAILITANTLRLAAGYVEVMPLGPVNIRGLREPVETFEVAGAGPVRTRLQALTTRVPTRLVGRTSEIQALGEVLERVQAGYGEVVALVGEPGVGKSRLVWELAHSPRSRGWRVLETSAASYSRDSPYFSVVDLLKAYFLIKARDDVGEIREKVTSELLTLDPALRSSLAPILALLEVPIEDPEWQRLEAPQRRQRTLDAVKRLLLRDSQVKPLCLIFEDLHWVDSESQALLDALVESLPGARLLLLVNYRPEYQHGWGTKSYYRQLRIDPLSPESAERFLDALVGMDSSLDAVKRVLIERTQGNPFFLEESVQTLVETRVLAGERGAYRLTGPVHAIQVPDTVQAVLAARIDRLAPEDKRLLQAASVIGETVPLALLEAVAELSDDELRHGLARLQAAEFLYETSLFPDPEYAFRHGLTCRVTYGAMLHEQRRSLHARIVRAMEHLHRDRLAEHVDRLAHHALQGGQWPEAVRFLREAGARAVSRSASREAIVYFEQALAALGHLPQTAETLERALDLRFDLQGACLPLGDLERMLGYLREAQGLAEALGDQRRLGRVFASLTHCFWARGDLDGAVESGRRALAIASALGDAELAMVANLRLGQVYFARGDYRQTVETCRACLESRKGDLLREGFGFPAIPAVISLGFMGRSLALLGDFPAGIATIAEAIRVAEAAAHPYSVVVAYWASGDTYVARGDDALAIPPLERARALSDEQNFTLMVPIIGRALGEAYALAGRSADALALLQSAVDGLAAMRYMPALPPAQGSLSESLLLAGRLPDELLCARLSLDLCRAPRQRGNEAYALRLLGEIHAAQDLPATALAEVAYHAGLTVATEVGNHPLAARCELDLGKLYRLMGDTPRAAQHLAAAVRALRALDMRRWLHDAERELAALGA